MSYKLNKAGIADVVARYSQTQAYFPGNDNVPILKSIKPQEAVELLNNATSNGPVAAPATDLLNLMREHAWCITAGVHAGGLGGAAGGADPHTHISLSVNGAGYHLRVTLKNKMWVLWDITGPGAGMAGHIRLSDGKNAAAARNAVPVTTGIDDMQRDFALNNRDALRAFAHYQREGGTRAQAVAWLREQKK